MKKLILVTLVLAILLCSTAAVSASGGPKGLTVTLSETPTSLKVGETIGLTAVSEKHGSSFEIQWTNAIEGSTVLDEASGCYISSAEFKAEKPGTYTISCEITMYAGKSDTEFTDRVERTIEVTGIKTLIGADIKDLSVTPVLRADGSIYAYKATGNVYSLWSDGTSSLYGSVFFNFGPSETTKNVTVTIYDKGVKYAWVITVNRP